MFNQYTVDKATQIALGIQSKDRYFRPKGEKLVKFLEPLLSPIMHTRGVEINNETLAHLMATLTNQHIRNGDVVQNNDDVLQSLVGEWVSSIKANIELTRGVVIPLINNVLDEVSSEVKRRETETLMSKQVTIKFNPIYRLFEHVEFVDLVNKFSNHNFNDGRGKSAKVFPSMEYDDIVHLMANGNPFYEEAGLVLKELGPAFITGVFNNVFVKDHATTELPYNGSSRGLTLATALVTFLICDGITDESLPEGLNISYSDLKVAILETRATAGYQMFSVMQEYKAREKTQMVEYTRYNSPQGGIYLEVVPSVYDKLTEQGLGIEVITGCVYTPGASMNLSELVANAQTYIGKFNQINQNALAEMTKFRKDTAAMVLTRIVQKVISDNGGDFKLPSGSVKVTLNIESLSHAISERIAKLDTSDDLALADAVRDIICTGMFEGTLAGVILRRMEIVTRELPDSATPEYIAMITVISICIDSMFSQIDVYTIG